MVIDFGSFYHGYTADITRTVALGQVPAELQKFIRLFMKLKNKELLLLLLVRPVLMLIRLLAIIFVSKDMVNILVTELVMV